MRRPWPLYVYAVVLYAFVFTPIVFLIVNSFNSDRYGQRWTGFTTEWYTEAWSSPGVVEAARNSLVIATVSTTVSLGLGTLASIALLRRGRLMRPIISGSTYARILLPELVLALSVLIFLSEVGFARGFVSVTVGHVLFSSAYVTMIVTARLARLSPATIEAARDLGATAWRTFWRVRVWEIMPAIVASGLLVFTFSLDDVVTSYFLAGSTVTLPLYVFGLIRFEVSPMVNALGTSMMAVTTLLIAVFGLLTWRWSRRAGTVGSET